MTNPLSYQPAPAAPSPPMPPARDGPGVWIAWAVIGLSVALVFGGNLLMTFGLADQLAPAAGQGDEAVDPAKVRSIELEMAGRNAVGVQLLGYNKKPAPATQPAATQPARGAESLFDGQVREAAKTPLERLRATALIGELEGTTAAVDWLKAFRAEKPDAALDREAEQLLWVYLAGPESIDATSRASLIRRHGWFARLALSAGKPDADPERQAVLAAARRTAWTNIAAMLALGGGAIASVALFIVALIRLFSGRVGRAYSEPRPGRWMGYSEGPQSTQYRLPTPGAERSDAPDPPSDKTRTFGADHSGETGHHPAAPPYAPAASLAFPTTYAHPALVAAMPLYPPHLAPFVPWAVATSFPIPHSPDGPTPDASDRAAGVRTGPFLEMFALYLGGQIALSLVLLWLASRHRLQLQWLMFLILPAIILWPRWRGISWTDLRRGLGWHAGQGAFREIGAGLAGYLAGLPVVAVGAGIGYLITQLTGAQGSHPIGDEVGRGVWANAQIVLLACVWAPIVEESMFRGALFHHLRRRHAWWVSASVTSFVFAAIHPQGLAGVPVLMSLAIVFAALREWRGSLIGPIAAHALNNGMIVAMLLLTLG